MSHGGTRTGLRRESGAAAVEFALVSTLLFIILFGIIQYGLYFNDSLNNRQGVREAARMGVVENFASAAPCTSETSSQAKLACTTKAQISPQTGAVYVRLTAPSGWAKGKPLVICGAVKESLSFGFVPLPYDGWIYSKTQMSIEQTAKQATTPWADYTSENPTGIDWNQC